MKLSKRLTAICQLVPENSKVIDVGADHALVDIYLNKNKNCTCLATDISSKALGQAKENIKKYKANVQTKVTDGLKDIYLNDQIIIITGMGTSTIVKILMKNIKNDIIISSHTNHPLIRKFMMKKGYRIHKEIVVKDKFYYVITYYKYKKGKKTDPYVSPFLTKDKEYMNHLLKFYQIKYDHETNIVSKIKYKKIIKKINKTLEK